MAYFTAVIAKAGSAWKARDVEVEEFDDLDELAEALRAVAVDEQPVLAVIEHEDEWFAIVRVDGEEEPRVFVSDLPASARSHYGPLLVSAADVDAEEELGSDDDDDVDDDEDDDVEAAPAPAVLVAVPDVVDVGGSEPGAPEVVGGVELVAVDEPERPVLAAWAGEVELLEDFGVPARSLRHLAEERGDDPAAVLAEVGETAGFAELLEALR